MKLLRNPEKRREVTKPAGAVTINRLY